MPDSIVKPVTNDADENHFPRDWSDYVGVFAACFVGSFLITFIGNLINGGFFAASLNTMLTLGFIGLGVTELINAGVSFYKLYEDLNIDVTDQDSHNNKHKNLILHSLQIIKSLLLVASCITTLTPLGLIIVTPILLTFALAASLIDGILQFNSRELKPMSCEKNNWFKKDLLFEKESAPLAITKIAINSACLLATLALVIIAFEFMPFLLVTAFTPILLTIMCVTALANNAITLAQNQQLTIGHGNAQSSTAFPTDNQKEEEYPNLREGCFDYLKNSGDLSSNPALDSDLYATDPKRVNTYNQFVIDIQKQQQPQSETGHNAPIQKQLSTKSQTTTNTTITSNNNNPNIYLTSSPPGFSSFASASSYNIIIPSQP